MCNVDLCRSVAPDEPRPHWQRLKGASSAADNAERETEPRGSHVLRGKGGRRRPAAGDAGIPRAARPGHAVLRGYAPGAVHAGLDPDTLRYERAIRYLVREGVLVWEERVGTVPGIDFYRLTGSGLELLREA